MSNQFIFLLCEGLSYIKQQNRSDFSYLICINVLKHPEINEMDIKTTLENKAAFNFGKRPHVAKLFGKEITNRADADII